MRNIWDDGAKKRGMVFVILGLVAALVFIVFQYVCRQLENERPVVTIAQGDTLVEKHINRMRAELFAFSKNHPVLRGIEKDHWDDPASTLRSISLSHFDCNKEKLPQRADCCLQFSKNNVRKYYPQFSIPEPTSNGIYLGSVISSNGNFAHNFHPPIDEHWDLQNGSDMLYISYKLQLGENLKSLDAPIREILRRNLQALRDDILKQGGWVEERHWRHF